MQKSQNKNRASLAKFQEKQFVQGQKEQKVINKSHKITLKNQAQTLPQERKKKTICTFPQGPSLSALIRAWVFHNTSPHRS